MAKRTIIGEIHYLSYIIRVMSDGSLLESTGHGTWRRYRKCRRRAEALTVYQNRMTHFVEFKMRNPAYTSLLVSMHALVPATKRPAVMTYIHETVKGYAAYPLALTHVQAYDICRLVNAPGNRGRHVSQEVIEHLYHLWRARQIEREIGDSLKAVPAEPETK